MDKGRKVRGGYETAYKLAGSTIDKKSLRLHRRSIDQKESRFDEIKKRRNLADLSPLNEGESIASNVSYKGKTPVKRDQDSKAKKGQQRLEQLQKWRQERELKRKLESQNSKKGNVFRVSKNVDHGDRDLFKKKTASHIVKAKPAPPAAVEKKPKPAPPATQTRATRTRNVSGPKEPAGRGREPPMKAPVQPKQVKQTKTEVAHQRTTRSGRTVAPGPSTRITRQTASKAAAGRKAVSKAPEIIPKQNLDKISTKRGEGSPDSFAQNNMCASSESFAPSDSFAPPDYMFNMSSFVFKPLSPNSAAGFLMPGQDASCASFLETNPKRSSTPKKENASDSGNAANNVTNKSNNTLLLENTAVNLKDRTTDRGENEKTLVNSPKEQKPRRRTRQSVANQSDATISVSEEANETVADIAEAVEPMEEKTPVQRRRSVQKPAADVSMTIESLSTSKLRRSSRRSVAQNTASSDSDTSETVKVPALQDDTVDKPESVLETAAEAANDSVAVEDSVSKGRRRSTRRSVSASIDTVSTVETPSKRTRKSTRRSVAVAIEEKVIEEVEDLPVSEKTSGAEDDSVFEAGTASEEGQENIPPVEADERNADLQLFGKKTPGRQRSKKTPRNKSFGGFRLPSTDSVVLSGKRKTRKSMMPKSPEEWVELLSKSPMIEMTRRRPKIGNTSLPILSFDDVDDKAEPEPEVGTSQTSPCETEPGTEPVIMGENDVAATLECEEKKEGGSSTETVQVEEVSSTQEGLIGEGSEERHDVPYFRRLLVTETERLTSLSTDWTQINSTADVSEDVHGQIRTTVGQAQLLMNQRFKQFSGLVDNCEFHQGEKETTCEDLQGFWDMIYFQVEDVDTKFAELRKLKNNNWVDEKPKPVVKKVKKKVTKPVVSKPAVKSKFAAFRAQMKQQKVSSPVVKAVEEEKVFEAPGFFTISSPVRTPKPHCEGGTPKKLTPAEQLAVPPVVSNSSELLLNRTPARRSYLPAVPSPLLKDTTPLPRPIRSCTQKTPKRFQENDADSENQGLVKRARRSLRPRKSVNFDEPVHNREIPGTPELIGSDADFARLLQPMNSGQEGEEVQLNDSFSKYLQPLSLQENTSSKDKENSPEPRKHRRASLKGCRSSEHKRSKSKGVSFTANESIHDSPSMKMPCTPYNASSLVKQRRVTRRSVSSTPVRDVPSDVFDIENVDLDKEIPKTRLRSPRPSLLYTPPELKRSPITTRNIPTATLISFSP